MIIIKNNIRMHAYNDIYIILYIHITFSVSRLLGGGGCLLLIIIKNVALALAHYYTHE